MSTVEKTTRQAPISYTMVTYTVKPGREQENAALVRAVFEKLAQTRPAGFRRRVPTELPLEELPGSVRNYLSSRRPADTERVEPVRGGDWFATFALALRARRSTAAMPATSPKQDASASAHCPEIRQTCARRA